MKIKWITPILLIAVLFLGCEKQDKTESKNMEQIYKEEGIPVDVQIMQEENFTKVLSYNTHLTGIKQSAAAAMMGGRIEKVHVKVGDYVEKDQVMFEFPEDAPAGQLNQARSANELAKATYERMNNLFKKGGISQQDLDGVKTQYDVSSANLDAALQMLKVRAPISGYVVSVNVKETDGVHAEDVLAFVSQTNKLKARVWVTEEEVTQIKKGQTSSVIWQDNTLKGTVTDVAIAMDMAHNAFAVDLTFDNKDNLIKSGVIGKVSIQTYENPSAFVLDRFVVKSDSKGQYIYKVKNDTVKKSYVQTGEDNGSFEILSGLSEGDMVITRGLNLVSENVKVKIIGKTHKS